MLTTALEYWAGGAPASSAKKGLWSSPGDTHGENGCSLLFSCLFFFSCLLMDPELKAVLSSKCASWKTPFLQEEKNTRFPLVTSRFLYKWVKNFSQKIPQRGQVNQLVGVVLPQQTVLGYSKFPSEWCKAHTDEPIWFLIPTWYCWKWGAVLWHLQGTPFPGRRGWKERQVFLIVSCLELLSVEGQEQLRQVMGIAVLHCH